MRKPVVFNRIGIPGSGGPDWLRNDYEQIICVTKGRIPNADPLACGKPPKYAPGGPMSYRNQSGDRKRFENRIHQDGCRGDKRIGAPRYKGVEIANPGNVLKVGVGGSGQMGHAAAHENEAPFPLELPAFYVKSFCPPNGVVCDPFLGSGTTLHAAYENGRRFVGCDLRQSQVDLALRRIKTVTPDLYAGK